MGISEWEEPGWLCRVAGKHGDSGEGCGDDSRSHNLLGPPREEGTEDTVERVCALVVAGGLGDGWEQDTAEGEEQKEGGVPSRKGA